MDKKGDLWDVFYERGWAGQVWRRETMHGSVQEHRLYDESIEKLLEDLSG